MKILIIMVSILLLQSGGCGGKNASHRKGLVQEARDKHIEAVAGISEEVKLEGTVGTSKEQQDESIFEILKDEQPFEIPEDDEIMILEKVTKGVEEVNTALSTISTTLESDYYKLVPISAGKKASLNVEISKLKLMLSEVAAFDKGEALSEDDSELFASASKSLNSLEELISIKSVVYEDEIRTAIENAIEASKKAMATLKETISKKIT